MSTYKILSFSIGLSKIVGQVIVLVFLVVISGTLLMLYSSL